MTTGSVRNDSWLVRMTAIKNETPAFLQSGCLHLIFSLVFSCFRWVFQPRDTGCLIGWIGSGLNFSYGSDLRIWFSRSGLK